MGNPQQLMQPGSRGLGSNHFSAGKATGILKNASPMAVGGSNAESRRSIIGVRRKEKLANELMERHGKSSASIIN